MVKANSYTGFTNREVRTVIQNAKKRVLIQGLSFICIDSAFEKGRLLVVTPRRLGSAPVRNKIRRRLKAIFYEHGIYAKRVDVIIFVKNEALALPFAELQKIMMHVLG